MERFRCKLCFKQFVNGKALGGHMRSHLAVLPLPPKTPDSVDGGGGGQSDSTLSLCCSSEEKDGGEGSYGLRENPRKRFRWADPELPDGESVGESTRNLTRRRSKRARRVFLGGGDGEKGKGKAEESRPEPGTCSFSDEEEVARCLMMMSRDFRGSPETERRRQGKLRCEICGREFKSTQALGSHRTTNGRGEIDGNPRKPAVKVDDEKMHECPFCERVFGSGQALGGHKRSHFFPSSTNKAAAGGAAGSVSVSGSDSGTGLGSGSCSSKLMIDLNMPAPMEDDDVSAVSDELLRVIK